MAKFVKGQSGNPTGRPKEDVEVKKYARQYGIEALNKLLELMRTGTDERTQSAAAQAILDRGFGKPSQEIGFDGESTRELVAVLQVIAKQEK